MIDKAAIFPPLLGFSDAPNALDHSQAGCNLHSSDLCHENDVTRLPSIKITFVMSSLTQVLPGSIT